MSDGIRPDGGTVDENKAAGEDPIRPGDAGWHLTSPKERLAVEFTGRLPQPVSPDREALREAIATTLGTNMAECSPQPPQTVAPEGTAMTEHEWSIDLICCGYCVQVERRVTWEAADRLREEWAASGEPHHMDRQAVVHRESTQGER